MSSRVLPRFDILNPATLPEAVEMLAGREGVSVLAGGTDMLVWNYIRKVQPEALLSLKAIDGLEVMEERAGEGLRLGAKARVAALLTNGFVAERYRALYDAAYTFATPQIRNMATVVGNVMRGSPAGDCSCAFLAIGGEVLLEGPDGERAVDIDDFWVSYGKTARRDDELAVGLRVRPPGPNTGTAFQRLTRVHEDLAKLNVAVRVDVEDGVCTGARLAMGCVGPTLVRLEESEALLVGAPIDEETLGRVVEAARDEINPIDDQRSTADYRRQVAGVVLKRTILRATGAAKGGQA